MPPRRTLTLIIAALTLAAGCDDDGPPPVDVPFEGLDPSARAERPKAKPRPEPEPEEPSAKPKVVPNTGRVQACCAALRSAASRAKDEGTKAVNKQAAAVCSEQARQVRVGRVTVTQALRAVRGSLLGKAPAACK